MRSWIALIVLLSAALAQAQPDPAFELARRRYEAGQTLYKIGKFEEALIELEAARALMEVPELDYNIGLCLAKLDRPEEAAEALERFVTARPKDRGARAIRKQIATLRAVGLKRRAAGQSLPLADERAPRPAVPETASTALPAAAPPAQADPQPQAASAPPAATRAAPSSPAFAPPAPPAVVAEEAPPTVEKRWIQTGRGRASVALATVAALLLGSAAVTGSLALVDRGAYNDSCDAHFCNHLLYERMHGLAIGTDVLIGVGAATALAAILIGVSK